MYARRIDGRDLTFRFDPRLHRNNLLFQDLETGSLWSQLSGKAIEGPLEGTPLEILPALQTTWEHWRRLHPETLVLAPTLGLAERPFEYRNPRSGIPVRVRGFPVDERVAGVRIGDEAKAFPVSRLRRYGGEIEDEVGGTRIRVLLDEESESILVLDSEGAVVPSVTVYWEAWLAFHPDTDVFFRR